MSMGEEAGHLRGDWTGLDPKPQPAFSEEEFKQAEAFVSQTRIAGTCGNDKAMRKINKETRKWVMELNGARYVERIAAMKAASSK